MSPHKLLAGGAAAALLILAAAPAHAVRPAAEAAAAPDLLPHQQTAVFSGGCFWGVQGVFSHLRGVTRAVSGYTGGSALTAHYEVVSTGLTGHAETVEVFFDPRVISYGQLLQVFFTVAHDPTEVGGQEPDRGPQYRSVIWAKDPGQQREALTSIRQLAAAHTFRSPIATRVQLLGVFYPAEAYHQDFLARHPNSPYIRVWDAPKLGALKQRFPALYVASPAAGA